MTLQELRENFPHTGASVYLNHAAMGPLSSPVKTAIEAFLAERHQSNVENWVDFMPVLDETRGRLARLIGASPERVEFMPNTSYGLNVLASGLDWRPGDRIVVPACEFPANVYPFLNLARSGVEVDFIPHHDGTFSLDHVEAALTPRTRLMSVSFVQFLSGFRADLAGLGALCRAHDVYFCVDAIQGLGALRLDVRACGIDFLACGGHKWLMAPAGTGFLYVTEALQAALSPAAGWLHGPVDWERFFDYALRFHHTAERFRLGNTNNMGLAGLHAALGLHFAAGPAWCEAQVLARSRQLAAGLSRLGLRRYGTDDPAHASGIVTVAHPAAGDLYAHLKRHHIHAAMRNRLLRFAPTYYNSPGEIDRALEAVASFGGG